MLPKSHEINIYTETVWRTMQSECIGNYFNFILHNIDRNAELFLGQLHNGMGSWFMKRISREKNAHQFGRQIAETPSIAADKNQFECK